MAKIKFKQADEDEFLNQVYTDATLTGTGTALDPLVVVGGGGGAVDSVNGATGVVVLDTDDISEGSTNKYFSTELAQDAVGAMVNSTLVYTDGTPLLARAAISGDITISASSNSASITPGSIINAHINASAAIDATKIADGSVTSTEFQYISTLSSNAQTQLDGKQAVLTGLTASVAELNFTDGVTSAIQTQLDGKVPDTGNTTIAGTKTFSTIPVLPGSDPTTANQATRKSYVDAIGQMVDPSLYKNACTCATTANITLSGEQTIDTFATSATRVLVWKQTAPAENGIYISNAGAWTRASDYNTAGEVLQGTSTFILDGGVNKDRLFVMNEASVTTLGTDPVGFTPLSSLNSYNPGTGILISGSDISFDNTYLEEAVTNGQASGDGEGVTLYYDTATNALVAQLTPDDIPFWTSQSIEGILARDILSESPFYQLSISTLIEQKSITTHSGTLVDDAIATFNGTTGLIQDSGIKIASGIIEPNTQTGVTLRSPTRTSTSTGFTTTISGGNSIQSGSERTGGDLVLQGGAGYDGGSYAGGKITLGGGSTGYGNAVFTGENVAFNHPDATTKYVFLSTSDIPTGSVQLSFKGSGVLQGLGAATLSDIASVPLYFDQGTQFNLTATGNRTILAPTANGSGNTTYAGARITIAHTASGADRTLSLTTGSSGAFRFSSSVPSLTATSSGTTDYITCVYNSTAARWDVLYVAKGSQTSPVSIETFPTDIQIFTSSGTWTKPGGTPKTTQIIAIGGGGGGGSGRKGAAGTVRAGGAGGGPGGYFTGTFLTSVLGATETVTVGTGGSGGAAISTNTTNGAAGSNGVATEFGGWVNSGRGGGGGGGTTGAATGGAGSTIFPGNPSTSGANGASSSGSGAAGTGGSATFYAGAGGGSGGGITTGNVASAGGVGGSLLATGATQTGYGTSVAGGTAGAVSTNGGVGGSSPTNSAVGGAGGGGGGSSTSTNAGAGGNGGLYGGGGGGGGASLNSVGNSGAGGTGGNGILIAITQY